MGLFDFLTGGSPQDRFAKEVMAQVAAKGWTGEVTYHPETFSIAIGEGTVGLGDGFGRARAAKSLRGQVIAEVANRALIAARGPLPPLAEAADRLRPVIRKRVHVADFWLDELRFVREVHQRSLIPIGETLCAMLVIDQGSGRRTVDDDDLDSWGVAFDDVMERALENLRGLGRPRFEAGETGVHVLRAEDAYGVSRILLPGVFAELPIKGEAVVLAPDVQTLLVAGSQDRAALDSIGAPLEAAFDGAGGKVHPRELIFIAARTGEALALSPAEFRQIYGSRRRHEGAVADMQRFLSAEALVFHEGAWRTFLDRRAAAPLVRLAQRGRLLDHDWQRAMIDHRIRHNRTSAIVSHLMPYEADGELKTWSVINCEAHSVTPVADAYWLSPGQGQRPLLRSREDLEAICGPFDELPGCWPPRLLFSHPPTPEQWARLRERPKVEACATEAGDCD